MAGDKLGPFIVNQLTQFFDGKPRTTFFSWLKHPYSILGITMGTQFLLLAIFYSVLVYKFFSLLDQDNLSNFADFKEQRRSLNRLSLLFIVSYFIRGSMLLAFGHYDEFTGFWKYEIYLLLTVVFEAPNLFYLYLTHMRSFKVLEGSVSERKSKSGALDTSQQHSDGPESTSEESSSSEGESDFAPQNFTKSVIKFDARFKDVYRSRASTMGTKDTRLLEEDQENERDLGNAKRNSQMNPNRYSANPELDNSMSEASVSQADFSNF